MIYQVYLSSILMTATFFDAKTKKIPNFFNLFVLISGLLFSICIKNICISKIFVEIIFVFLAAYPLYLLKVLGAGDVKLLMAIGLFLPHYNWLMLIFISILIAGVVFFIRLWRINELDFKGFHYYRFTHFILWAYFILLIVFKN